MQRHELAVLDADASDFAAMLADNLVHEFHRFEDAQDLPRDDFVADFDKGLGARRIAYLAEKEVIVTTLAIRSTVPCTAASAP